jgi:carboxylesterase type B
MIEGDDANELVPVPPSAHLPTTQSVDELSGLVMNIVTPNLSTPTASNLPVFVYVHGGSLLYGGANLPIFDAVNLVSHSLSIDLPIIALSFNYRVGIGGFLSGAHIAQELKHDGHAGSGNFGFTDQQVAFDWVQRYIGCFGGDAGNVTAVGESAGGISISNQMLAAQPPVFRRAVCMSGLSVAIPAWTMGEHDELFERVCRHFDIDAAAGDALDRLRAVPQQVLADATPAIQGVPSGTGNPCLDGWFYGERDPREVHVPPAWVEGFMIGDVYHEGVIFHINLMEETYGSIRGVLRRYIDDESDVNEILGAYEICEGLELEVLLERVENMCGDAIFKIPNYVTARECRRREILGGDMFLYHFDQRSRIHNSFEGTAYHAHELLYLFGNLENEMNDAERNMVKEFASAWIRFANGLSPWKVEEGERRWMVWGPNSQGEVKTEDEDQDMRNYTRMELILKLGGGSAWKQWIAAIDALVNNRQ